MWFRWEKGRQDTGYEKMTLCRFFFFDLYLIRYPEGAYIPPHTDNVPKWNHYRMNLIVRKAKGGEFKCPEAILNWSRLKFFRPDIHEHSVSPVEKGTRYVLSLGWIWL